MRISVVIPVYNVRRYLKKCINSVINQTYDNFEIILVDDKSTDGSVEICRQYKSKYPDKIVLIEKEENEGVDKARFTGINYALQNNIWGGNIH